MCKLLKHNHLTSSALNIPNSFARVCVPLACSNCQSWVQPSPGNHHASPSLTGASDASGYSKVKTHPIRSCCLCSIHLTFVKVVACEYGGLSSFVRTISARKDDMESFFIYSCDSCMDKCFIQLRKVTHYFFFCSGGTQSPKFSFLYHFILKPHQVLQQFLQVEKFLPSCITPCETRCSVCGYASCLS